jgi:hypothetical protein
MDRHYLCIAFTFFLVACSSAPPSGSKVDGNAPTWLNHVGQACKKSELCAVGIGESRSLSQVSGTNNIAKMFDVKVNSTFSTSEINDGGESLVSVFENIKEQTAMELEGVQHLEVYEDDKYFYTLTKVTKRPLAMRFKKEMSQLRGEINGLKKESSSGVVVELEELLVKWHLASSRSRFLTGFDSQAPMSVEQLNDMRDKLVKGVIVHVSLEQPSSMEEVGSYLGDLLTRAGYQLSTGSSWKKKSSHLLAGKLAEKAEFMQVKGFKKFSYLLTLDAQDPYGVKSSQMSLSTIQTGRDTKQARLKAVQELKKQLKSNMNKISFKRQE